MASEFWVGDFHENQAVGGFRLDGRLWSDADRLRRRWRAGLDATACACSGAVAEPGARAFAEPIAHSGARAESIANAFADPYTAPYRR
jgi:hypothetical protein